MKFRLIWMGPAEDPERHPEDAATIAARSGGSRYEQSGTGLVLREWLPNGRVKSTPLANFTARIVRDIIYGDDPAQGREFGLEVDLGGHKISVVVPAAEFARMGWVLRQLGPQAIIYPGQQQHARAAIQYVSGAIRQERLLTHLGWTKQGGQWVYVQSRGAVGAEGTAPNLQVRLAAPLQHYDAQPPADLDLVVRSVRASLGFLSIAPDRITLPLLAAVYRTPLGDTDFSVFLTGRTGTFKTALAALCQQHFGAAMDARRLPGHFASTANALEELAFQAKDALLAIDDFAPTGRAGDAALEAIAERLFRAGGNRQGRSRMSGPQLRPPRPPRALLLATGEEVPHGHSIRARLLIMELRPGDVGRAALSRCQIAGLEGQFAAAMGAYLAWIARDYENLRSRLRSRSLELRGGAHAHASAVHARLPGILAQLQSGWEMWLQFAMDVGALSNPEQIELEHRGRRALEAAAANQVSYHQASDPALRFIKLLRVAIWGGRAHVADRRGLAPESAERWGWQAKPNGRGWLPQGTRIGWLTGDDVFLEPLASYQVAQQMAGTERLPLSAQTLRQRLQEQHLLASVDAARNMLLVRRTLEGCPRKVLHLKASDLVS